MVQVYESGLWRRSPLLAALFGIGFEREYALVARAAELAPGQLVLDLACGPGIYARRLARAVPGGTVVGLDLSRPMLVYAARRSSQEAFDNVVWVRGDALDLPFQDAQFDVVNCAGAIHLFPDVPAVLDEVERVLKPGGCFTVVAIRRGESAGARLRARVQRRLVGIDAFSEVELSSRLAGAGLASTTCLHSSRLLLIMKAAKP